MLVTAIRHWQTIAAFAAGAAVGALLVYAWANAFAIPDARQQGREAERAAALERSMEIIRERSETNAEVDRLDAAGICAALGGEWVPEDRRCR